MKQVRKRCSLKSLSPARRELIVCMHEKQDGVIRSLPIIDGEPVVSQAKITRRRKFAQGDEGVIKRVSMNYCLKPLQKQLLETISEMKDGVLEGIKFRDGLPMALDESVN